MIPAEDSPDAFETERQRRKTLVAELQRFAESEALDGSRKQLLSHAARMIDAQAEECQAMLILIRVSTRMLARQRRRRKMGDAF